LFCESGVKICCGVSVPLFASFAYCCMQLWSCYLCCEGLVEDGYHQNPYHNAVHAADVTQAVNCFMLETKVGGSVLVVFESMTTN